MNFATLDLNLLRVFNAMVTELSTVRAGERLGLSQPAVSSSLGRLRHILQDDLFVREGNRMGPTARAQASEEPDRAALQQLENALSSAMGFSPATAERNFIIAGSDYVSTFLIPRLARVMRAEAPGTSLQMLDVPAGKVFSVLREGRVDVAVERGMDAPDWVSQASLYRSFVVCLARRGHPVLAANRIMPGQRVPLEVYCEIPQVILSTDGSKRGSLGSEISRRGFRRTIAVTVPHFQAIALAAASSDLLGNAPVAFARHAASLLALDLYLPPFDPPVIEMRMYWHRRLEHDPSQMWLRTKVSAAMEFDTNYPPDDLAGAHGLPWQH